MSGSQIDLEPAPLLGEHSDEVLVAELGAEHAELEALRASGVIR